MSQLPADQAIERFQANEERVDKFVNGYGSYTSSVGVSVETLPSFVQRKDEEINNRYPGGYTNRGAFASGTNYVVNDIVTYGGLAYLCLTAYTSSSTTPDNDRTHWVVWQGVTQDDLDQEFVTRDDLRSKASFSFEQLFNLLPRPKLRPSVEFIDAVMSGTVKVVIVGDSISAGADIYYSNSYAQNLTQMLKQMFPWITWNVVNYAIGGRGIANIAASDYTAPSNFSFPANNGSQNINCQYWPTGSVNGKSWRDHVKDEAPDLIVFAFGMNDGTDVNSFSNNFDTFYAYTQTWTKKPWFILNSCFLPTNQVINGNNLWQTQQKGQQEIADWVRHASIYKGFGLVDVNSIYRLLRDGVRREFAPFKHEVAWRYWGDASKWNILTSTPALTGGTMSWTSTGLAVRMVEARDVDCSADFRFDASDSVARWNYRSRSNTLDLAGYCVQMYRNGNVDLYYGSSPILTVSTPGKAVGAYANIRIKATGPLHEVWIDGQQVMAVIHGTGYYAGSIFVGMSQGVGAVANLLLTYASEDVVAPQYFDEEYLIGAVPYGDLLTNPDSGGGNAINHPSTLGSFAFYIPAVRLCLKELGEALFERMITVSAGRQNATITAATLPSLSDLTEHQCKVTVPSNRWAIVHISFGYKNTSKDAGVILLMIDGNNYDSWWLPCTTMTQGSAEVDPYPRNFAASVPVLLGPGTHTFSLRFGSSAAGAVTSSGGGASRTLAVQVMPS